MRERKADIQYSYRQTPSGVAVDIAVADPRALAADEPMGAGGVGEEANDVTRRIDSPEAATSGRLGYVDRFPADLPIRPCAERPTHESATRMIIEGPSKTVRRVDDAIRHATLFIALSRVCQTFA